MAKLRVHNIESGPASSDVALGITGDTIAVSSDSLKLNVWKDSGGNTLFQSDGSGTVSNVNSGFTGAGPTLILSQTADASSSISFTADIDSTYDKYMFVFTDIDVGTDNTKFHFQCSTDGGSNYNTTLTTTAFRSIHNTPNTISLLGYETSEDEVQSTDYQTICYVMYPGPPDVSSGILYLYAPSSTTYVKHFYSRFTGFVQENSAIDFYSGGYFNTTSAIDAINFKMNSGTFSGKIKMYGVS